MKIKILSFALLPFYLIYLLGVSLRNFLFDHKILREVSFDFPIINVGNLSAGGNGKTPMVEYLVRLLGNDYRIAVLSRGYGRQSKGFHEVIASDTAAFSGDEPMQIKLGFGDKIRVFVGEDRLEAITKILFDYPETELIILDDAFQHRTIKPGFNLLLSDFSLPFFLDKLLPIGRLREPKSGAKRADAIIFTKCPDNLNIADKALIIKKVASYDSSIFFSTLNYGKVSHMGSNGENTDSKKFFLVTAIANPQPLEMFLNKNYTILGSMHFRDHHRFSKSDIASIEQKIANFADPAVELITTNKDAVRFADFIVSGQSLKFKINVIPVMPEFQVNEGEKFNEIIKNYVRTNSTDSRIHQVKN